MTEQVVEGTGVGQGTHTSGLHLLFRGELELQYQTRKTLGLAILSSPPWDCLSAELMTGT